MRGLRGKLRVKFATRVGVEAKSPVPGQISRIIPLSGKLTRGGACLKNAWMCSLSHS